MKCWLLVGFVAACGSVDSKTQDAKTADSPVGIDTAMPDAPPPPRCDPTKPFGALQVLANVNSPSEDITPYVTPDELQIWFSSNRPGSNGYDIYMATRTSKTADFGTAALVAGVNGAGDETRPILPADGLTMYIQYHANPNAAYKITSATRSSTTTGFGTPSEVTEVTQSGAQDDAQFILPDHSAMYFNSNRSGAFKIYRSVRTNGHFQTPALADGVDLNAANDDYPVLLPDEKTIYFLSSRTGTVGTDNFKATRPSTVQAFGAASLVTELNTTEGYYIYSVTADDCIAYVNGPNGNNGNDLFVAKKPL